MGNWTLDQLNNAPPVLKPRDVQAILDVSWPKALQIIHSKGFPAIIDGKLIRIPTVAFAKWLEAAGTVQMNNLDNRWRKYA